MTARKRNYAPRPNRRRVPEGDRQLLRDWWKLRNSIPKPTEMARRLKIDIRTLYHIVMETE